MTTDEAADVTMKKFKRLNDLEGICIGILKSDEVGSYIKEIVLRELQVTVVRYPLKHDTLKKRLEELDAD